MHDSSNMQAPIYKLDSDILHEIFKVNAVTTLPAGDFAPWSDATSKLDLELRPLALTCRSSHVCKLWRDIILQSPTIWAKCIDFDLLCQWGYSWMDRVFERAKDSLLSVRATNLPHTPFHDAGRSPFFVETLTLHWNRIREVDIFLDTADFQDPSIMDLFCRPAPYLEKFFLRFPHISVDGDDIISPVVRQGATLFSNQAPSLVFLSCPGLMSFPSFGPFYTPSSKIRYLTLAGFRVTARNLLNACLEMHHLEVFKLQLVKFDQDNTTKGKLPQPIFPKLGNLFIQAWSFEIYPQFLDCITPASGCSVSINHNISHVDQISSQELDNMQSTLLRYAKSFLAVNQDITSIYLFFNKMNFAFGCENEQFLIDLYLVDDNAECLPPGLLSRLADNISLMKFPHKVHRLDGLFIDLLYYVDREKTRSAMIPSVASSLSNALNSMNWVTHISFLYFPAMRCLNQIPGFLLMFPALTSLSISVVPDGATFGGESIKAHIVYMHKYIPLQLITLAFEGDHPQVDIRFMNECLGLTVSWTVEGRTVYHNCGVDDPEHLNLTG